jgi:hypothetical protein
MATSARHFDLALDLLAPGNQEKWAGSELKTRHRDFQSGEERHSRQRHARSADEP